MTFAIYQKSSRRRRDHGMMLPIIRDDAIRAQSSSSRVAYVKVVTITWARYKVRADALRIAIIYESKSLWRLAHRHPQSPYCMHVAM